MTRGEPCQVPVSRSSYAPFRICYVILGRPTGITRVCDPPTVISTCDATAKRKRKRTSVDRKLASSFSASFAFPSVRRRRNDLPRCTRNARDDFCRCRAPRYPCLPTSSNALDRRSRRNLDFLESLLKRARYTKKERRDRFLCQSRHYIAFENTISL